MKNIILIGAGNIGSRHLQALRKVKYSLNIIVIEKDENSIEIAKQRYFSIKDAVHNDHNITFLQEIKTMPFIIDIAIIATNSNQRFLVLEQLLISNQVKNVILEKVLFQKPEEYDKTSDLIKEHGCRIWVNTQMRMMKSFKEVKENFPTNGLNYYVSGSNWGMMCNTVHFLDYMSYLTNCSDFKINIHSLDKRLVPAKRDGFYELFGTISFDFGQNSNLIIQCYPTGDLPRIHEIFSSKKRFYMKEMEKKAWIYNYHNENKWNEINASYQYQSELTIKLIEDLIENKVILLPKFSHAKKLHLNFFNPILQFIQENIDPTIKIFPFT